MAEITSDAVTVSSTLSRLCVITPTQPNSQFLVVLEEILASTTPLVQVRRKNITDSEHIRFTTKVVKLCHRYRSRCVVNDRVDIAQASEADGVHLGADDMDISQARKILPSSIIGATCRTEDQARQAAAEGASYLGVGPAFASTTKPELTNLVGPKQIGSIAAAVTIPVFAIGGITTLNIAAISKANIFGAAVVATVFEASDPAATAATLEAALRPTNKTNIDENQK